MGDQRWRRTAARLLAALVLAGGIVPVLAGAAWACSCVGYPSEEEQYREAARSSKVIYTGTVTERSQASPRPSTGPQPPPDVTYTVQVEENLKGGASGTRVVSTSESSASCGVELQTGRRALLVEYAGDQRVGLCDGTTQERVDERAAIVRDEVRRQGGPGPTYAPAPSPRPGAGPTDPPSLPRTGGAAGASAWLGVAAAATGLAAVAAARRRRA
ncbi:MAG TPA: hypothetical protein VNA12_07845 [Mycobacteriales bacterium]|nr:hypothetical protein [Mycobacteriales bacterium]